MKITKFLILRICLLLLISQPCLASSDLIISRSFNILAVNGAMYKQGLVDQERRLNLKDGVNRIVIEYEEVFESDQDDNFDVVKSAPFLLEVYLQKDRLYRQQIVKPNTADAARQFSKRPVFSIISESGNKEQKVSFKLSALAGTGEAYLAEQSRLQPNASINISSSQTPNQNGDKVSSSLDGQSMATKMLNYWWLQATPEEKQKFLQSINQ